MSWKVQGNARGRLASGGFAGWAVKWIGGWLKQLHRGDLVKERMVLVDRIALGPRQSLALVEADGRRFLVAISAESGPSFLALDDRRRSGSMGRTRTSW